MQKNVKEETIYQIHFKKAHGSRKIIHLKKDKTFFVVGITQKLSLIMKRQSRNCIQWIVKQFETYIFSICAMVLCNAFLTDPV